MATVTSIADLVCGTTGLATTSTERAIVIAAMNHVYRKAVRQSGVYRKALTAASLTSGTADYTIGSSPFTDTDVARIRYLTQTGGGQTTRLKEISEADMLTLREASSSGTVSFYCVSYPTIMFWPTPGSGVTVNGSYEAYPKTLVESNPTTGEESTPTAFPAEFHENILYHGAVVRCMEYDNRNGGDAEYHAGAYDRALAELSEFVNQVGGVEGASVTDLPTVPVFPDSW